MNYSTTMKIGFVGAFLTLTLLCLKTNVQAGLVAYWPLDELTGGGTSTPDVAGGFDMDAFNLIAADVVPGKIGNAFSFDNTLQTLLSRVHDPADPLPINKHPAFTITMWANVTGTGQNDLRLLSEGSLTDNNPLFNIGTHSGGATGQLDSFLREPVNGNNGHPLSDSEPFDGTWHHIGWTFENGVHTLYVDGAKDPVEFPWPSFANIDPFPLDNTSIGGIQRAAQSHWVTGLIDDVAMWDEVLSPAVLWGLANEAVGPDTTGEFLIGDFNVDDTVDLADFDIFVDNFRVGSTYPEGDINLDGSIDLHDFGAFVQAFNASQGGAAVPEPSAIALMLLGFASFFVFRLRRR